MKPLLPRTPALAALAWMASGCAAPQPKVQVVYQCPPHLDAVWSGEIATGPSVPPEEHGAHIDEPAPIDDGVESAPPPTPSEGKVAKSVIEDLSDDEIKDLLAKSPEKVGSLSIGKPNGGRLFNGVQMPKGEHWELVDAGNAWGTQETVDYIQTAIGKVHQTYPDAPLMRIGHISGKNGGHLSPHKSHQSGRDVDISYFYTEDKKWYAYANADNLDRAKTWAFVRAVITDTDPELILIDYSIQKLLKEYAIEIGEDQAWLDEIFQFKGTAKLPLIRHAKGHATHIHIRFYNPAAQSGAVKAYPALIARGILQPPVQYIRHTAKSGDTLGSLANRYKTTVAEIMKLNKLPNNKIFAKKTYLIPKKNVGFTPPKQDPVVIPKRQLPPSTPAVFQK